MEFLSRTTLERNALKMTRLTLFPTPDEPAWSLDQTNQPQLTLLQFTFTQT
ncbi:hypothetical protein SIAM614_03116 [Stappia aggregata IAM 12614]|uniref:Uncharacterized protein n=1 Tax=Roseibium aggregatum (strain ATCC 25650 / DSM 13394 / JCM 20685 / NBRC 16684 / NCIMB 2208 / IAM 12614 / B1) TaxID=384765 RepID=A0NUN2_ROSAI|nr:hypothetical protein SIAM614_03116 [Stappia aggregata IAM 12614] [Roseibium aggregatum IAM 12614]